MARPCTRFPSQIVGVSGSAAAKPKLQVADIARQLRQVEPSSPTSIYSSQPRSPTASDQLDDYGPFVQLKNAHGVIYLSSKGGKKIMLKETVGEMAHFRGFNNENLADLSGLVPSRDGVLFAKYEMEDAVPTSLIAITQVTQLRERHVANLIWQLSGGLLYMHHLGFVHGSLGGHNVFLSSKGVVKISDTADGMVSGQRSFAVDRDALRRIVRMLLDVDTVTNETELQGSQHSESAREFLESITSTQGLVELRSHPFLSQRCPDEELMHIHTRVNLALERGYSVVENVGGANEGSEAVV